ncbi:unnamed protein product [Urochloa humidicola]
MFVGYPRLASLWARLLPRCAPPSTTRDAAESVAGLMASHNTQLGHTAALASLWSIWKCRNRNVFDDVQLSTGATLKLLSDHHLLLWFGRAPRKLDVSPLDAWCKTLLHPP